MMHAVVLSECHDITAPLVGTSPVTGARVRRDINVVVAQCRRAAEDWAQREGIELANVSPLSTSRGTAGVTFTVQLGKGSSSSVNDPTWVWSARAQHWAALLAKVFPVGRGRSERLSARPDGTASVTALHPPGDTAHRSMFGTGRPPTLNAESGGPDFSGFSQAEQPGGPTTATGVPWGDPWSEQRADGRPDTCRQEPPWTDPTIYDT